MKTILTVVGARPQFIKAAHVSEVFKATQGVLEIIVHTGLHYDSNLSDLFFDELEIPSPDYNLAVGSGTHGHQTGKMLAAIEDVLLNERPNIVLVYGDTNSTLAGALAAAKLNIQVAHVEAGLRSYNIKMPEEINRVLTDHLALHLFAPTPSSAANLKREGISPEKIHVVGDVMFDSLLFFSKKSAARSKILETNNLTSKEYILATIHRAENTDDPIRLKAIFSALTELGKSNKIVLPIHPRTRKALSGVGGFPSDESGLTLLDPIGYLDILMLEKNASLIITDSGGIQKEAFFHMVPCITLRDETEWTDLIKAGWNRLVPPKSSESIISAVNTELKNPQRHEVNLDLFGHGHASKLIAEILLLQV